MEHPTLFFMIIARHEINLYVYIIHTERSWIAMCSKQLWNWNCCVNFFLFDSLPHSVCSRYVFVRSLKKKQEKYFIEAEEIMSNYVLMTCAIFFSFYFSFRIFIAVYLFLFSFQPFFWCSNFVRFFFSIFFWIKFSDSPRDVYKKRILNGELQQC